MSGGHGGGFKFKIKKGATPEFERLFGSHEEHHEPKGKHAHKIPLNQQTSPFGRFVSVAPTTVSLHDVQALERIKAARKLSGNEIRLTDEQLGQLSHIGKLESQLNGTATELNTLVYQLKHGAFNARRDPGFMTAAKPTNREGWARRIRGGQTSYDKVRTRKGQDKPTTRYKYDVSVPVLSRLPFFPGLTDAAGGILSAIANTATRKRRLAAGTVRGNYEKRIIELREEANKLKRELRHEFGKPGIPTLFSYFEQDLRDYYHEPTALMRSANPVKGQKAFDAVRKPGNPKK